jgi:hypothetical protein
MWRRLVAAAGADLDIYKRRIIRMIVAGVVALVAAIVALVASCYALFVAVALHYGPLAGYLAVLGASLIVLVAALVLARQGGAPARDPIAATLREERWRAYVKARAVGESMADVVRGRSGPLKTRSGLAKAALGALVIGLVLGRRV